MENAKPVSGAPVAASRRDFLRQASAATAAAALTGAVSRNVLGANDRFGVGFIGAGGRAQAHLHEVANLKKNGYPVDIVAVTDAYKPRAAKSAERFGAKLYTTMEELLADPNVNVVCIATPDHHHGAQAIAAV
jgi:ornithine cyclodeaminase/alanine dehydrogenase-like protein (mu-crystallin family)